MQTSGLTPLGEQVYYLPGSVNAALIVNDAGEAILIDTGQDKVHGRRLKKACDMLGVTPVAVVNTHSHADHYGGNDYLARNLKLPVYAPPFEAGILQNPYVEPVYLFGGAKPLPELLSKWLLAKPSPVDHLLTPGVLELHGMTLDIIESSGHAHTHYAVRVGDVLIAADAVFGEEVLERYPLPFGQDIGRQTESAQTMAHQGARVLLPGHGEPTEAIADLVEANLAAFERAADTIAQACIGVDTAGVLKNACDALGITMNDLPRYYLNHCTVMAYLSYLRDEGRVDVALVDNEIRWYAR